MLKGFYKGQQNKEIIIGFFERKIIKVINSLGEDIFNEERRIAEEFNSRGILASGMCAVSILEMINKKVLAACEETLKSIEEFQKENNVKIKDPILDSILNKFSSMFVDCYMGKVENVYKVSAKLYLGETLANSVTNQVSINTTATNIIKTVENNIKDIKTYNKIRKEEPSVKASKNNTLKTIIVSVIIAIIGYYITLHYGK